VPLLPFIFWRVKKKILKNHILKEEKKKKENDSRMLVAGGSAVHCDPTGDMYAQAPLLCSDWHPTQLCLQCPAKRMRT